MSDRRSAERDFDAFYRAQAPRVVHLIYASTGDLTLAQDCTQEAYSRAWQRWSEVSAYDDPGAWVRTVARRLAISAWRKRTNQDRAHVRHGGAPPGPPPSEDRVAVLTALGTLNDTVRETVALHYLADLSVDQIAHETNTPAGTVKARLHRGRALLRLALQSEEAHRD